MRSNLVAAALLLAVGPVHAQQTPAGERIQRETTVTPIAAGQWTGKRVPLPVVLRHLRPYVIGGFIAVFVSGGLLFWSAAARMLDSPAFIAKLVFIALAGINALYFELVIAQRAPVKENHSILPSSVRYAGLASLSLWTLVVICGPLIPYLPA